MLRRGLLVYGSEPPARAAPRGPEVDQGDGVLADGVLEVVGTELHGGHVTTPLLAERTRLRIPPGVLSYDQAIYTRGYFKGPLARPREPFERCHDMGRAVRCGSCEK